MRRDGGENGSSVGPCQHLRGPCVSPVQPVPFSRATQSATHECGQSPRIRAPASLSSSAQGKAKQNRKPAETRATKPKRVRSAHEVSIALLLHCERLEAGSKKNLVKKYDQSKSTISTIFKRREKIPSSKIDADLSTRKHYGPCEIYELFFPLV